MKMLTRHWIGILFGLGVLAGDIAFFSGQKVFYFMLGIAVLIGIAPFMVSMITEYGREKEKDQMFLEFARSLVESVKMGTPISKSIIQMREKDFGSLSPHVKKLANQIALGIPTRQAFEIFASDINSKVINRSIALITEAEESGGEISMILESTAKSVSEIEDLKKERKSSTYNLVVQGYIIFIIFLVIMLAVEVKFIPLIISTISETGGFSSDLNMGEFSTNVNTSSIGMLNNLFLGLILVQGLFAGLVIGRLSEGRINAGIKHSVILLAISYLLTTGVRAFI